MFKRFLQSLNGNASRENVVTAVSGLNVGVNLLISVIKVLIGVISRSAAILSEGVNNAADAATSVLALIGSKLSRRHPDKKHPFGYGRIEYLTGLVIGALITFTGAEMLIESWNAAHTETTPEFSMLTLILVAVFGAVKFFLGVFTINRGKAFNSDSLTALGKEGRNDAFVSLITLLSAVIYLVFRIPLDGWAGMITSALIIKAGIETLISTLGELIGRPGEKELADKLYHEIRSTPNIVNAADMMLHNYGPDAYSGSVNIELDQKLTVGECYAFVHELQLRLMHEYNVTMVFGMYAVDNDSPASGKLRSYIADFVRRTEHVRSYHAVYLSPSENKLYCDLVVDYDLKSWDKLRDQFTNYMKERYPEYLLELTIETEYV